MHSLPLFVRLQGRPVILLGDGDAADAKRRLLERAGALVVAEAAQASLAIVAIDDEAEATAAVARLKMRGILVNATDRPTLCDFTLPAIVDRDPVLIAIGTGGTSAGLAAALRRRLEAIMPSGLGGLADALFAVREELRVLWPDPTSRRRAIANALDPGGIIDPLAPDPDVSFWLMDDRSAQPDTGTCNDLVHYKLTSPDPDDLTLRQARDLANADRVYHSAATPIAILDRARADAARILVDGIPVHPGEGLSLWLEYMPLG